MLLLLLLSAPTPWSYWGGAGGGCPSPPPLCWMGLQFYTFPTIPSDHYTHYTTIPSSQRYHCTHYTGRDINTPLYHNTTIPLYPLYRMDLQYSTLEPSCCTGIESKCGRRVLSSCIRICFEQLLSSYICIRFLATLVALHFTPVSK